MSELCWRIDLGRRGYETTCELMRRLVVERQRERVPDVLLMVEHPPTYTVGRGGKPEHVLVDGEGLAAIGAVLVATDRGGDVTFHGPGQLVGYPIIDLRRWKTDVHEYLRALESVLMGALLEFGIEGYREPGRTGVWHRRGKLAAIGVRVSRWVTSHGFALNVSTDLEYFNHIVPCGIVGCGVSSMDDVLRAPVSASAVRDAVGESFGEVFSRRIVSRRELALEDAIA